MEECIYYTQAGYGWCVSGYGCYVRGIGMLCRGFDAARGHSAFLASWHKNNVESLCRPPKMRSVPVLVLRMYAWHIHFVLEASGINDFQRPSDK
jgi:hypothetical protein